MDVPPQTLSIFVTVFVILAAMGMALLVDLLKGNVEQLREVAIDLNARKEAAERQVKALERQQQSTALVVAETPTAPRSVPALLTETAKAASAPAPAAAEQPVRSGKAETSARRAMSPAVAAVADSVAARMSSANGFRPAAAAAQSPDFAPAVPANPQPARPARTTTAVRKNWSEILKSHKHGQTAAEENGVNNLIPFDKLRSQEGLPAGYHDYAVLQRAAATGQAFTGLAISIGTNQLDRMQLGMVGGFLRSLIDTRDFACATANHDFLLVCPDVEGEEAQRRLAGVAEKLWDFQLRSMGSINVQFSWGGKEGHNEVLNDVVAAAVDQMLETRRARPVAPAIAIEYQQAV